MILIGSLTILDEAKKIVGIEETILIAWNSIISVKNQLKGTDLFFTGASVGGVISWFVTYKANQAKIKQLTSAAQKNLVEIEQISEESKDKLNKSYETLSIGLRSYRDAQEQKNYKMMDDIREECLNYLNSELIHYFEKLCSYKRHLCGASGENKDIFENDVYPTLATIAKVVIELNDPDLLKKFNRSPYLISKSSLRHSLHICSLPLPIFVVKNRFKRWQLQRSLRKIERK